jgi:hypothetical protein
MTEFTLQADTRLRQNPDVILRIDEPGGPMLFNPDNCEMRILNDTGLWIWQHCAQAITMDTLTGQFLALYDQEDPEQLKKDLSFFVQDMTSQGYIGILC